MELPIGILVVSALAISEGAFGFPVRVLVVGMRLSGWGGRGVTEESGGRGGRAAEVAREEGTKG